MGRLAARGDRAVAEGIAIEPVRPAGEYEEAIAVARQLGRSLPNFRQPYNTLIAALGQVGRVDEAHTVMDEALARFGERFRYLMSLPLDEIRELRPEDREHLIEGFRKAGLV